MADDGSSERTTPDEAAAIAEEEFGKAKEMSHKDKLKSEEEFVGPPGQDADIAEAADAFLKQTSIRNMPSHQISDSDYQDSKQVEPNFNPKDYKNLTEKPSLKQCEAFAKRMELLRKMVAIKIMDDSNAKAMSKHANPDADLPDEDQMRAVAVIDTDDRKLIFRYEADSGRLHIMDKVSVLSEADSYDEDIMASDIILDKSGVDIYRYDFEDEQDEVHRIFPNKSESNEVDINTPRAIEKAEDLINLYLNRQSTFNS